jgi:hypothetical protein
MQDHCNGCLAAISLAAMLLPLAGLRAAEWHVAVTGEDNATGTVAAPLQTIQRTADLAQPGDIVTVHAGVCIWGIHLDWMAQGTRISGNLFHDNAHEDLFVEVNHGPFLVDNNIFLSPGALYDYASQGGAYVHNLFAGTPNIHDADGLYLVITADKAWATERIRQLVTTELLGKAVIPDQAFENPDGTPLRIDTDYFGKKRNEKNPFPGPFEISAGGKQTLKVWETKKISQ